MLERVRLPHLRRTDEDVLSVRPHRLTLPVALQWLAHVEGIAAVVVVVRDAAVDGVARARYGQQSPPLDAKTSKKNKMEGKT